MSDEIKVLVYSNGRKYLYMRYKDPINGKMVAKSTGKTTRKEAIKVAAKWEQDLQEGRYKPASKVTWAEFRERYAREVLSSLANATAVKVSGVFNAVEELIGIDKLAKLDSAQISRLQSKLRDEKKLSESTIKGHLAHLKAALNWAKRIKLIAEVPTIEMPRRAKGGKIMKGRAITTEEFERMLEKVSDVLEATGATKPEADDEQHQVSELVQRWKWFLRALWFSGLRIGEAIQLYWDRSDKLTFDLSGEHPMLLIPAELEKGNKDRLMPLAPEFAEMILSVPEADRTGPVFKLGRRNTEACPLREWMSRLVSEIGKAANVKVNTETRTGKVKFASAHDLRRSFGVRWSDRVMPQDLQEMMRHESLETTMKFYVGRNANTTAKKIWDAFNRSMDEKNAKTAESSESSNTLSHTKEDATSESSETN